jgi:hypothetical protein
MFNIAANCSIWRFFSSNSPSVLNRLLGSASAEALEAGLGCGGAALRFGAAYHTAGFRTAKSGQSALSRLPSL